MNMNTAILEKANQMIKTCENASFGVIDESGFPSVSAISLCNPKSISELVFTTNIGSNKYKRLQANNKVSICHYTDANNLTLVGTCEILIDQETKDKYWQDWFTYVYPEGKTDPTYCVIKFTTKRVSLWIDEEGAEFSI